MQSIKNSDQTATTTKVPPDTAGSHRAPAVSYWLVLALVAVTPALFWTGVFAHTTGALGASVSGLTLFSLAASIAATVVLILFVMMVAEDADQHFVLPSAHEFMSNSATRLDERLALLGLDPLYLRDARPATYQQMRQACGTCAKIDECERDLEIGNWEVEQTGYCPNAPAIDMLIAGRM